MAGKSKTEKSSKKWWENLKGDDIREALEEACTDAYGEYEQHTGLLTMLQQEVEFPFPAKVMGETIEIVDMEWPEEDEFGLDLVCERNGERHRIAARNVELLDPLPTGHLYLAAYLDWKHRF